MQHDYVNEIRNIISIKTVIEEQVKLSRKGKEYLGCCPFHNEKTPSFFVNVQKGFYYCFGCQAKGNIFNFYMDYYRMSFQEALEALAQKAGVVLPKGVNFSLNNDNNKKLRHICSVASNYFQQQLYSSDGKKALKYLYNRGLNDSHIKQFQLGYAPYDSSKLWNEFSKENIFDDNLLEIGLKACNKEGELYSFFRNRIIFPITDKRKEVIAFGGRALGDEIPKYLNTKESIIFYKKRNLYAMAEALSNLKAKKHMIVVEGYMDVIALHNYGFNTAVAGLGTAVSVDHLKEINQYDSSPIFCMDGDEAGKKASIRVIDLYLTFLEEGMNPRFVFLNKFKDPDEFLQNNSKVDFETLLNNSQSISEVLWEKEVEGKNLVLPEVSTQVLKNLRDHVKNIKSHNLKQSYISFFKNKIYNKVQNNFVKNKYKGGYFNNSTLYDEYIENDIKISYNIKIDIFKEQSYLMMSCVIQYPELLPELEDKLAACTFVDEDSEQLRCCIINNINYINNKEELYNVLNNHNLTPIVNKILQSNLVKPISFNDKTKILQLFNSTYNFFIKSKLEVEKTIIHNNIMTIKNNIKILQQQKLEMEVDSSQIFSEDSLLSEQKKLEKLTYQLQDVMMQILQIK